MQEISAGLIFENSSLAVTRREVPMTLPIRRLLRSSIGEEILIIVVAFRFITIHLSTIVLLTELSTMDQEDGSRRQCRFPASRRRMFSMSLSLCLVALVFGALTLENWWGLSVLYPEYYKTKVARNIVWGGCQNATASFLALQNHNNKTASGLAIVASFNHRNDIFKRSKEPIPASFDYIESWYNSVQRFPQSIRGIVLHNMFTKEQTTEWRSNMMHFVQVHNDTPSFRQAKSRPINDMRFFVLKDFLRNLYALPMDQRLFELPDYVLFTDSYDVQFLRNPFDFMQQMDTLLGAPQIYVGEEYAYRARKTIWDEWMNKSSYQCFQKPLPPSARMINCGILGGRADIVLELLDLLIAKLKNANAGRVCDQSALFYVLTQNYQDKFISGYPLNTLFNQWETTNDTLAYIAHK